MHKNYRHHELWIFLQLIVWGHSLGFHLIMRIKKYNIGVEILSMNTRKMSAFGRLSLALWVSKTAGSVYPWYYAFIVQETNVKRGILTVLFQTESHFFLFQTESHFFCFRQRVTFLFQTESHFYVVVWNKLWRCNFFSMGLFEYFFRQFSYKSIQMTIFQVSLGLVEGLQRKSWKKVTQKWTNCFY